MKAKNDGTLFPKIDFCAEGRWTSFGEDEAGQQVLGHPYIFTRGISQKRESALVYNKIVILFLEPKKRWHLFPKGSFGQDKAGQEIFDHVYLFPKVRSKSEMQIKFLS